MLSSNIKHLSLLKQNDECSAVADLNSILLKMTEQQAEPGQVSLVLDRSKRDVGLLIRLYQL